MLQISSDMMYTRWHKQRPGRLRGVADLGEALQSSLAPVQLQVGHVVEEVQLSILIQQHCQVSVLLGKPDCQASQQSHMLLQHQKMSL